jgi:hypothetical protein
LPTRRTLLPRQSYLLLVSTTTRHFIRRGVTGLRQRRLTIVDPEFRRLRQLSKIITLTTRVLEVTIRIRRVEDAANETTGTIESGIENITIDRLLGHRRRLHLRRHREETLFTAEGLITRTQNFESDITQEDGPLIKTSCSTVHNGRLKSERIF